MSACHERPACITMWLTVTCCTYCLGEAGGNHLFANVLQSGPSTRLTVVQVGGYWGVGEGVRGRGVVVGC